MGKSSLKKLTIQWCIVIYFIRDAVPKRLVQAVLLKPALVTDTEHGSSLLSLIFGNSYGNVALSVKGFNLADIFVSHMLVLGRGLVAFSSFLFIKI